MICILAQVKLEKELQKERDKEEIEACIKRHICPECGTTLSYDPEYMTIEIGVTRVVCHKCNLIYRYHS